MCVCVELIQKLDYQSLEITGPVFRQVRDGEGGKIHVPDLLRVKLDLMKKT